MRPPPWDRTAPPPTDKTHSLHVCLCTRLSRAPAERTCVGLALGTPGSRQLPGDDGVAERQCHDGSGPGDLSTALRPWLRASGPFRDVVNLGGQEHSGACRGLGVSGPKSVLTSLAATTLGPFRCGQLVAACWGPLVTRAHSPGTPWCPTTHLSPDTDCPHSCQAMAKGSAPWDPTADAASGPEARARLP